MAINYDLNDAVTFIRHNKDGISEGTATLTGIGLDGDGRTIVLLKDSEGAAFNTSIHCLNPTPEFCEQFRAAIAQVNLLAAEGDAASKAIVKEYNERIQDIYSTVYGKVECGSEENSQEAA